MNEYEGDGEFIFSHAFRKFAGSYTVIADRFFLATEDRGNIAIDYRDQYTITLSKPNSITIQTKLVSNLGNDSAAYCRLSMLGGRYYQAPDTLHVYLSK